MIESFSAKVRVDNTLLKECDACGTWMNTSMIGRGGRGGGGSGVWRETGNIDDVCDVVVVAVIEGISV